MSISIKAAEATAIINDRLLTDLADGTTIDINFPQEKTSTMFGKNGNRAIVNNAGGDEAMLTLRILKGSRDDLFMNGLVNNQGRESAPIIEGQVARPFVNNEGSRRLEVYSIKSGAMASNVNSQENVSGDLEQTVAVYSIRCAAVRSYE